jgi:hypothetical protein
MIGVPFKHLKGTGGGIPLECTSVILTINGGLLHKGCWEDDVQ